MIQQLESQNNWDICIIGGGATGLGTAVDAASRGFRTILFEKNDFAHGTSSRSTKLVHGGVRYLQQGNVKLVMEALRERGLLLKNAPHLVKNLQFIVPNYKWWEGPFYGIGLKIYDWMAGKLGLGSSQFLSREETISLIPALDPKGLRGGISYHDGQFDDARLAISLAQTAVSEGGTLLNYFEVSGLLKKENRICGLCVTDKDSNKSYEINATVIINATGVFSDSVMNMDEPDHKLIIKASQGIHLVVDKEFLPGDTAIMIPKTDDGRVLFAVPWHGKVVLGTTDTAVDTITDEPVALTGEIEFILTHIGRYLARDPQLSDIKSVFAGLRPLVKANKKKTAALSRDHFITISEAGLVTIAGGKWTTYRKMAEDVVNIAMGAGNLPGKKCRTKELKLYGYDGPGFSPDITGLIPGALEEKIRTAIENEQCLTVEDFLSRRTRQLLLDAKIAIASAPLVASIMARHLHKDESWVHNQIDIFNKTALHYLPHIN